MIEVSSEKGTQKFFLDKNKELRIQGPLGETAIEIKDGKARITNSPCPLKLCVRQGDLDRPGRTLACLPNRVVVGALSKTTQNKIDAVSR